MTPLDHIIEATRNAGAYASDRFDLPEKVTGDEPILSIPIYIRVLGFIALMTLAVLV